MGTSKWNKDKNDMHSTYLGNTQVIIDFRAIEAAQQRILLIQINVDKARVTRCYRGPGKAKFPCSNHLKNVSICSHKERNATYILLEIDIQDQLIEQSCRYIYIGYMNPPSTMAFRVSPSTFYPIQCQFTQLWTTHRKMVFSYLGDEHWRF